MKDDRQWTMMQSPTVYRPSSDQPGSRRSTSGIKMSAVVIVIVNVCVAGIPTPLLAVTVIGPNVPGAVGVPEITPVAELSASPGGSVPAVTTNVGLRKPAAAKVWLYNLPTLPAGGAALVIAGW